MKTTYYRQTNSNVYQNLNSLLGGRKSNHMILLDLFLKNLKFNIKKF